MSAPVNDLLKAVARRLSSLTETPQLDAQVLLSTALDRPRTWIRAHPDSLPDSSQLESLETLVRRLEGGEAFPYLLGHREFFGIDFELTPDVLIPRPETELLVERAVAWLEAASGPRNIVDIGTGCGCIAVSLALKVPHGRVLGTDISMPALRVAARNARRLGVADRVDLLSCDLLPPYPRHLPSHRKFDLVCANLPYIPTGTLRRLRVYGREPALALNGGVDGLTKIRGLLKIAPDWIAPGGLILLEIEASRGRRAVDLAHDAFPQAAVHLRQDLAGLDRLLEIEMSRA